MNQHLKNLSQWLKAKLIIFNPKSTKLDYGIKLKLSGRRLTPISTVKYLTILLDEHLSWTKQVNCINSKLNQTIGTLSKLRDSTSLHISKNVYHSLFASHLQYGIHFWGQGSCVNQNNIQNLQNQALRKVIFKKFHDLVNPPSKDFFFFLNSKTSFTFKPVCLYYKLNKIRRLQNLL